MIVHLVITPGLHCQIEQTMPPDVIQHVIKKSHAGICGYFPAPVQLDSQLDIGFPGGSANGGLSAAG
jgi:hypothetical protein